MERMIELRTALAVARERVIRCSLKLAATAYDTDAVDVSWEAELYSDNLDKSVLEYVKALEAVKEAK
jgi:hypothetical protein